MSDIARERDANGTEIRLASEVATLGIGVLFLVSAALPTTDDAARVGLLTSAVFLFLFAAVWFHVLPESVFGQRRFLAGIILVQVDCWFLLFVTGGVDSRYYPYFLLPLVVSSFALRLSASLVVGAVASGSYFLLLFLDPNFDASERDIAVVRLFGLISITLVIALITRAMETTRSTLRRRSGELAEQNRELEAARSIALRLSQLRERDEIIRALFQAARDAIGTERTWLFLDAEHEFRDGYTLAADGVIERFQVDQSVPDPVRLRAVREMRSVVIEDSATETGVSARVREQYGLRAAVVVPLVYRGQVIAITVFSYPEPRLWEPLEVRLAETIAEGSAPAVATHLALDELRDGRERLAQRTKVLEGLANLSESLGIATDDKTVATSAARNLHRTFDLRGATVLFSDPSLALLEPRATAGETNGHPVVSGPGNCPAIRSGRLFRVASADSPVICPHVSFVEGTLGYVCMPLVAAGQSVGAFFLEPTDRSILDEALLRGASERIALTVANQRVLETAQRQAITDGLTGLYNRHFMSEQLRLLHSLATRHARGYSVIAIDVDHLKQVNDTFGHEMGDAALRGLANALKRTLRASDVPVKTGGDEFLVLLPDTELAEAARVAKRIRDAVDEQGKLDPDSAITVSLGVAGWRAGRDAKAVLEAADSALYTAKGAGRDRIAVEPDPVLAD
ncbi:MAG TPA: diguanylate cyclase [Candidatus Dormibacteraeota bacterium]|jgi:diguanylate cyclase (GGDEF)-like protein|nr:diguanylate cyclase [Candidatus Dormibacteraeota bacterium]